jgi:nucleotide-binding universal stress UspA family protein
MFKRLLLPVDMTNNHEGAIQQAAELVRFAKGELTLLHIVERIPGLEAKEDQRFYDRLESSARAHLQRLASRLPADVTPAHVVVRFGSRAVDVALYAQEAGSDLIVLTCPSFDPKDPSVSWGSLSWKISLLAPCPVFLVKRPSPQTIKMESGIDSTRPREHEGPGRSADSQTRP